MASDEDFSSGAESDDSDKELQIAFEKGLLKPGLNVAQPADKAYKYDQAGLTLALEELKSDLAWKERLDMSVEPLPPPRPMADQLGDDPDDLTGEGVHDDFKREMYFYRQAQAAVFHGLPKMKVAGIPTKRPEDYFAEMSKPDSHMKKVREKLLERKLSIERSEKARKMRDLRKYGKKVQIETLQKRQREKKEMLASVKKVRKGQQTSLDFLDDKKSGKGQQKGNQQGKKEVFEPNKNRQRKNTKFGFGGQKKRSKWNTADSAADFSGGKGKKGGAGRGGRSDRGGRQVGGGGTRQGKPKAGNKNKRPGKMRRQQSNSKK